jgi:cytoskeleton protein RodZ
MGAFGDNLRREREMRGITLTEISESTKISKRWLQALEEEQFSLLPGGVFNRGFVRAYARFLGISEDAAVADYLVASNEKAPEEDKFPLEVQEKPEMPRSAPRRFGIPVAIFAAGVALVVGGVAYWMGHKTGRPPGEQQNSGAASNTAAAQSRATATDGAPQVPAGPQVPGAPQVKDGAPQSLKETKETKDKQRGDTLERTPNNKQDGAKAVPVNTPISSVDAISTETEPESGKAFSVVIKAKESSWVSIAADGHTLWEGTLNPNNQRSVTTDKKLILRTGNAAGLDVSYNGKALGSLGKDKQVRTLTFNSAGWQQ